MIGEQGHLAADYNKITEIYLSVLKILQGKENSSSCIT